VEGGLTIQTLLLKTTNGHRETPHQPLKRREHLSLADACPTPTKHFLKKNKERPEHF
jgi:hypothetical protein